MAVSPAEEILRTLKYNYTATSGSGRYSQTSGTILGMGATGTFQNKMSCSCFINGNGKTKNVTSNGSYSLLFDTGSQSEKRTLKINLKITFSNGTKPLDITYSFINLGANKVYTLSFDVDGFVTIGSASPRLYNMTLVLGSTVYTYDNIFGPIATCSDIFAACGVGSPETSLEKEVVYAYNSTDTIAIANTSRTY